MGNESSEDGSTGDGLSRPPSDEETKRNHKGRLGRLIWANGPVRISQHNAVVDFEKVVSEAVQAHNAQPGNNRSGHRVTPSHELTIIWFLMKIAGNPGRFSAQCCFDDCYRSLTASAAKQRLDSSPADFVFDSEEGRSVFAKTVDLLAEKYGSSSASQLRQYIAMASWYKRYENLSSREQRHHGQALHEAGLLRKPKYKRKPVDTNASGGHPKEPAKVRLGLDNGWRKLQREAQCLYGLTSVLSKGVLLLAADGDRSDLYNMGKQVSAVMAAVVRKVPALLIQLQTMERAYVLPLEELTDHFGMTRVPRFMDGKTDPKDMHSFQESMSPSTTTMASLFPDGVSISP